VIPGSARECNSFEGFQGLFGVLINVGSSSSNPNGRGKIFKNFSFEYLPIPEKEKTVEKVRTYGELGLTEVRFPDLPVHLDPEFATYTYGHVRRGFGDIESFLKMKEDKEGVLFFYATLQNGDRWFPYIIGYFQNLEMYDCRRLTKKEIMNLKTKGFSENAHIKRIDPSVDFLIKGGHGSRLSERAFPMADNNDPLQLRKSLDDMVFTATGKRVESGKPWFRWTLTCDAKKLINALAAPQR
jgi:hypothetical protein